MIVPANYIVRSGIFFSCTEKEERSYEVTVPEHALVYVYSGSMTIRDAGGVYVVGEGQTVFLRRQLLATFIKNPGLTGGFRSVSILLSKEFLQNFYAAHRRVNEVMSVPDCKRIEHHPLLVSLFDSILPYYELHGAHLPQHLIDIKLQEAMTVLRIVDGSIEGLLANFSLPGKIDFVEFMLKNYVFNLTVERFASLTGRSLATFKRDFQRIFHTSPQKWLLTKRLKQAHFLLSEKKMRPSEVYLEVGFENLSHFSTAFKKHFGYSPSHLSAG